MRQNLTSGNGGNTIDLTDEDDPKPQRSAQNNPPALVALNVRGRTQIMQAQTTVQRHVVTTQQPMRSQIVGPSRKLATLGMFLNLN